MTAYDPFERPSSQPDGRRPDAASQNPGSGYEPPGYAAPDNFVPEGSAPGPSAPGYTAPQPPAPYQPAPGLSGEQYPQYGTAPQGPGTYTGEPASTDGISIAALVTGILGLGVVAAVLGALGLRRTAAGQRKGTWLAAVGLALGLVVTIAATAVITWSLTMAAQESNSSSEPVGVETDYPLGSAYGDDPALDALWDACAAGDGAACDDLYTESPVDSEYEEFGDNCGERGRPLLQTWCEEGRDW